MTIKTCDTLVSLFHKRVAADPQKPALLSKDGILTWQELAQQVLQAAAGLAGLGVQPGDRVIQVSENRREWIVCDLAIQFARAIHVPIHAPLTGPQVAYQIKDSGARIVLVSTDEQARKLAATCDALPDGLTIVSFDSTTTVVGDKQPIVFADVCASNQDTGDSMVASALQRITADSLATILYTSGTTGEPKGVMLSQRNLTSNTLATIESIAHEPEDVRLNFLPLSHVFARTCDLYTWIASGCQLALAQSRETVIRDCQEFRPTILNGVPYFFDRVRRYLVEEGRADEQGSLQEAFGGRLRLCGSGGAALPEHVYEFYQQRGIPILEGYGLTETSPVICISRLEKTKPNCVGVPISGVDVEIAEDGEIRTRGPHVMTGYYNNQSATDEVLRDGWFYTGDLGAIDEEGFLKITGRKKEIIVTSAGKNIAPVYLESLLTEDPIILQAVVIGDDRNFLTALIVPDADNLMAELIERGIDAANKQAALESQQVYELYEEQIEKCLADVSHHEQVRRFTLLGRSFTIESGELTPKMSLVRKAIQSNFAAEIDAMYSATG